MQSNSKSFSRMEEQRILADIKSYKQGLVQLENFEKKKKLHDQLEVSRQEKEKELNVRSFVYLELKKNYFFEKLS